MTEPSVIEALRPVHDPELHRSIVDLGMVKGIAIDGGSVQVQIALTIQGCPLRNEIQQRVTAAGKDYGGHALQALALLDADPHQLVISDLRMPNMDGLELLGQIKRRGLRTELILITAHGSIETAVEAMKQGAFDYITKPFDADELKIKVGNAFRTHQKAQLDASLKSEGVGRYNFVGNSPALREIRAPIRAVNADKFPTNLETNRRHMPGYEAAIVAGSGHYPMLEDPPGFAAALDRALEQVLAGKPGP